MNAINDQVMVAGNEQAIGARLTRALEPAPEQAECAAAAACETDAANAYWTYVSTQSVYINDQEGAGSNVGISAAITICPEDGGGA